MPIAGAGRGIPVLLLSLGLVACASASPARWEKPGANDATTAQDASACRAAAHQEAVSFYPFGYAPYFSAEPVISQQDDERNRLAAEDRFFNTCMRDKGYVHAEIAPGKAQ